MKKLFVFAFALAIMLLTSQPMSAQTIVSDFTGTDGIRVVNFKPDPKVCSENIKITLRRYRIVSVEFTKGCPGNTEGIGKLVEGMKIKKAIKTLEGTTCGKKATSCPDQLAMALKMIRESDIIHPDRDRRDHPKTRD